MACDTASIAAWAKGIGLDPCIGAAYCAATGSLPQSIDALNSWGQASGYKSMSGAWQCTPSPNPGTGQPPGGSVPIGKGPTDPTGGVLTWISQNPILAAGAAIGAVLLLKK